MNPFDDRMNKTDYYNISTDERALSDVADFLSTSIQSRQSTKIEFYEL